VPFHGGFGLLNIHGVAKPVYRAFEVLHGLGTELTPVEGGHPTVDAWTIKDVESATVLLTNYGLPRHPIATESIHMTLIDAQSPTRVTIRRIDADHANAKRRWQEMGSPKYPNAANIEELNTASLCRSEPHPFDFQGGTLDFDVTLPPLSVAAVTFQCGSHERG
jgi:xylan 1,4-beta-xylosidase